MRLNALRLQNFRQHAATRLVFERGLTGIIGPNGAGKSTILEAIAWALYGNAAARGTRDSIRFSKAKAREPVQVELDFELAGHRYRVVRGLTSAECFLDGGDSPIASTISGVNELLQRRLGMSRTEFFHTYFTGQKELDVMAALGPAERARFLSRVLGYDRLSSAQELVRERRRALVAEANGLKQGVPDSNAVWRQVSEAEARVAMARTRAVDAERVQADTSKQLEQLQPQWADAQTERERRQKLLADVQLAESEAQSISRDLERLDRDLAAIAAARLEVTPLAQQIAELPARRQELAELDVLAGAEANRQVLVERRRVLVEELARNVERQTKLETAPQLERDSLLQLTTLRETLAEADREAEGARTTWARDRQEAETRLESLRTQYGDLDVQRTTLLGLGEESPCPTCGRPLGASFRSVVDLLTEQIETLKVDGNYYSQRAAQLKQLPEPIVAIDDRRRTMQGEIAIAERRLAKIQAGLTELATLNDQHTKTTARLADAEISLKALPMGYDASRHLMLRGVVQQLTEVETRVTRLNVLLERENAMQLEAARARLSRDAVAEKRTTLEKERATLRISEQAYAALRDAHERAAIEARRAELESVAAAGDVARSRSELEAAESRRDELVRLQARLEVIETDKRLHDELDRAYTDLRTDLNFQLRPELAEIASAFLDKLTDGRYSALEFDEDYNLVVLEDGLPKPVISGGEEDLCNLVLRLAISQMIADRAGQSFSLLVLDEVFGSLDDTRRDNVVELLRRLQDRFEQVIVITHIEQVREGLDRVLVVRYNEETGAASVSESSVSDNGTADDMIAGNDSANHDDGAESLGGLMRAMS